MESILGEIEKKAEKSKVSKLRQSRSTQTLLKGLYDSHYQLLEIIDRKANIIITVNSVILSLIMGGVLISVQRLEQLPALTSVWPLIVTTVTSLFLAIMAIYPHRNQGDPQGQNFLFYENHAKISRQEFRAVINNIVESQTVHQHMADDVHHLGNVLVRKNKFLRYSLIIFLLGMFISVVLLATILPTS